MARDGFARRRKFDQHGSPRSDKRRRFIAALFVIAAISGEFFGASAKAAGTVPGFSLSPQFDLTGKVTASMKAIG